MTSHDALPCAVPVEEQLERIPADAVLQWVEPDGLKAWHHVPIGRLAHEAAAAIRELRMEVDSFAEQRRRDTYALLKLEAERDALRVEFNVLTVRIKQLEEADRTTMDIETAAENAALRRKLSLISGICSQEGCDGEPYDTIQRILDSFDNPRKQK